ncbi:MAG TPA: hypothetical protein VHF47_14235 [Acidimicrobiales bacterium]|nr:hypothetical protein [Acidimicrobiales bacterium]
MIALGSGVLVDQHGTPARVPEARHASITTSHRDCLSARVGLRVVEDGAALALQLLRLHDDVNLAAQRIDVAPLQAECFAGAEAAESHRLEQSGVPRSDGLHESEHHRRRNHRRSSACSCPAPGM